VVVDVVLPAVLGLVLVREAGVETWSVVSEGLLYIAHDREKHLALCSGPWVSYIPAAMR